MRPLFGYEIQNACQSVVEYHGDTQISIGSSKKRCFTFDSVFNEQATQEEVYRRCCHQLVESFCEGYNATIFAYGQTGSGKTHSMGTACQSHKIDEQSGIIPRFIHHFFDILNSRRATTEFSIQVSFLEIHNEDLCDLLNPTSDHNELTIREAPTGEIQVMGAVRVDVQTPDQLFECLERGSLNRATGSTDMNQRSSRSHAIFTIHLTQRRMKGPLPTNPETGESLVSIATANQDDTEILTSKFHFVDLAGSERIKRTNATGARMKEGININYGLFTLGNVISALSDSKRSKGHIPFRDSKITRLLQDSLGGNSQTMMIACVSPADINEEESLNTLAYASRAKHIKNKPVINRDPLRARIDELEKQVAAANEELSRCKHLSEALAFQLQDARRKLEAALRAKSEESRMVGEAQMFTNIAYTRLNALLSAMASVKGTCEKIRDKMKSQLAQAATTSSEATGEEEREKEDSAITLLENVLQTMTELIKKHSRSVVEGLEQGASAGSVVSDSASGEETVQVAIPKPMPAQIEAEVAVLSEDAASQLARRQRQMDAAKFVISSLLSALRLYAPANVVEQLCGPNPDALPAEPESTISPEDKTSSDAASTVEPASASDTAEDEKERNGAPSRMVETDNNTVRISFDPAAVRLAHALITDDEGNDALAMAFTASNSGPRTCLQNLLLGSTSQGSTSVASGAVDTAGILDAHANMEEQLADVTTKRTNLEMTLSSLNTQATEAEKRYQQYSVQVAEKEKEVKSKMQERDREFERLRKDLGKEQHERAAIEAHYNKVLRELQNQLSDLQTKLREAKKERDRHVAMLTDLKAQIARLKRDEDNLRGRLSEQGQQIRRQHKQNLSDRETIIKLQNQNRSLSAQVRSLKNQLDMFKLKKEAADTIRTARLTKQRLPFRFARRPRTEPTVDIYLAPQRRTQQSEHPSGASAVANGSQADVPRIELPVEPTTNAVQAATSATAPSENLPNMESSPSSNMTNMVTESSERAISSIPAPTAVAPSTGLFGSMSSSGKFVWSEAFASASAAVPKSTVTVAGSTAGQQGLAPLAAPSSANNATSARPSTSVLTDAITAAVISHFSKEADDENDVSALVEKLDTSSPTASASSSANVAPTSAQLANPGAKQADEENEDADTESRPLPSGAAVPPVPTTRSATAVRRGTVPALFGPTNILAPVGRITRSNSTAQMTTAAATAASASAATSGVMGYLASGPRTRSATRRAATLGANGENAPQDQATGLEAAEANFEEISKKARELRPVRVNTTAATASAAPSGRSPLSSVDSASTLENARPTSSRLGAKKGTANNNNSGAAAQSKSGSSTSNKASESPVMAAGGENAPTVDGKSSSFLAAFTHAKENQVQF